MYLKRIKTICITERLYAFLEHTKNERGLSDMHEALCFVYEDLPRFSSPPPPPISESKPRKSRRNGRPPGPKPTHQVYSLEVGQSYEVKYPTDAEYPNDPNGFRFRDKIISAYRWHNKAEWNNEREHSIKTGMKSVTIKRTK